MKYSVYFTNDISLGMSRKITKENFHTTHTLVVEVETFSKEEVIVLCQHVENTKYVGIDRFGIRVGDVIVAHDENKSAYEVEIVGFRKL